MPGTIKGIVLGRTQDGTGVERGGYELCERVVGGKMGFGCGVASLGFFRLTFHGNSGATDKEP